MAGTLSFLIHQALQQLQGAGANASVGVAADAGAARVGNVLFPGRGAGEVSATARAVALRGLARPLALMPPEVTPRRE